MKDVAGLAVTRRGSSDHGKHGGQGNTSRRARAARPGRLLRSGR
jgi:hypothetical protein